MGGTGYRGDFKVYTKACESYASKSDQPVLGELGLDNFVGTFYTQVDAWNRLKAIFAPKNKKAILERRYDFIDASPLKWKSKFPYISKETLDVKDLEIDPKDPGYTYKQQKLHMTLLPDDHPIAETLNHYWKDDLDMDILEKRFAAFA